MVLLWLRYKMSDLFKLDTPIEAVDEDVLLSRFEYIYKENRAIDFIIDRTVEPDLFSEIIDDFDPLISVEKTFIAKPITRAAKQPLALLRLKNDIKFYEYAPKIIEILLEQRAYTSTRQIICGWGYSEHSLDSLKTRFQKNLIAKSEGSAQAFVLRWYDPRVQYVFQNMAPEVLYHHYLADYKIWEYLHPKGVYSKAPVAHAFKFNNIFPKEVIDFLMMCEDVNGINKYLINKNIPSNQIEPMLTYEYLILIKGNSAKVEFNVISELVYWFYRAGSNLTEHPAIQALWDREDYEQMLEKLNTDLTLQANVLERDRVNG
jgi:hypothetical protein